MTDNAENIYKPNGSVLKNDNGDSISISDDFYLAARSPLHSLRNLTPVLPKFGAEWSLGASSIYRAFRVAAPMTVEGVQTLPEEHISEVHSNSWQYFRIEDEASFQENGLFRKFVTEAPQNLKPGDLLLYDFKGADRSKNPWHALTIEQQRLQNMLRAGEDSELGVSALNFLRIAAHVLGKQQNTSAVQAHIADVNHLLELEIVEWSFDPEGYTGYASEKQALELGFVKPGIGEPA